VRRDEAILSDKDRNHPTLAALPGYFGYEPEAAADGRRLMAG
jgi:hypothetical protein